MYFLTLGIQSADSIECYACGLAMIDPIEDKQTYNLDPDDPEGKMYNETCIVFDTFLLEHPKIMSKWLRTCPENVKSCFWAKGGYNSEGELYKVEKKSKVSRNDVILN